MRIALDDIDSSSSDCDRYKRSDISSGHLSWNVNERDFRERFLATYRNLQYTITLTPTTTTTARIETKAPVDNSENELLAASLSDGRGRKEDEDYEGTFDEQTYPFNATKHAEDERTLESTEHFSIDPYAFNDTAVDRNTNAYCQYLQTSQLQRTRSQTRARHGGSCDKTYTCPLLDNSDNSDFISERHRFMPATSTKTFPQTDFAKKQQRRLQRYNRWHYRGGLHFNHRLRPEFTTNGPSGVLRTLLRRRTASTQTTITADDMATAICADSIPAERTHKPQANNISTATTAISQTMHDEQIYGAINSFTSPVGLYPSEVHIDESVRFPVSPPFDVRNNNKQMPFSQWRKNHFFMESKENPKRPTKREQQQQQQLCLTEAVQQSSSPWFLHARRFSPIWKYFEIIQQTDMDASEYRAKTYKYVNGGCTTDLVALTTKSTATRTSITTTSATKLSSKITQTQIQCRQCNRKFNYVGYNRNVATSPLHYHIASSCGRLSLKMREEYLNAMKPFLRTSRKRTNKVK